MIQGGANQVSGETLMLRMPCSSPSDGHFNREHNLIIFHQSVFLVKSCFQEVKVLMVLWNCQVFLWRWPGLRVDVTSGSVLLASSGL